MDYAAYLDPHRCPLERPALSGMTEATRHLHEGIDDAIRAHKVAYLHPDGPTVQTDLFGGAAIVAWQEALGERTMLGESCWSDLPPIYARYGTESTRRLLNTVKDLYEAEAALVADSGMQAIALVQDALLVPDAHAIVSRQVYAKSKSYLEWCAARMSLSLTVIDEIDPETIARAVTPKTMMVFVETYSNPLMRALDPDALSDAIVDLRKKQAPEIRLVVDDTIATPWGLTKSLLSRPGIDVVVGAGTKAMGGQDRDIWGYVASNDIDLMNRLMTLQAMRGGILSWRSADAILAALPHAHAAFERRCESATRVTTFLRDHPEIEAVFHPSHPEHPDRAIIDRAYTLPGSLVSFRLRGSTEAEAAHFCNVLATTVVFRYALSFDGLTSKVNHHASVSEFFTPPEVRVRQGIDRLVRLAIGAEDSDDLSAALGWAIKNRERVTESALEEWREARRTQLGLFNGDGE